MVDEIGGKVRWSLKMLLRMFNVLERKKKKKKKMPLMHYKHMDLGRSSLATKNLSFITKNSCKSTTVNNSHRSFVDRQTALEPNCWSSDALETLFIPPITTFIPLDPVVGLHPLGALDVAGCTFGFPCNWILQFVPKDINNIIIIIINTSSIIMMMSVPPARPPAQR